MYQTINSQRPQLLWPSYVLYLVEYGFPFQVKYQGPSCPNASRIGCTAVCSIALLVRSGCHFTTTHCTDLNDLFDFSVSLFTEDDRMSDDTYLQYQVRLKGWPYVICASKLIYPFSNIRFPRRLAHRTSSLRHLDRPVPATFFTPSSLNSPQHKPLINASTLSCLHLRICIHNAIIATQRSSAHRSDASWSES